MGTSSGPRKPPYYTKILAANARVYGYLDGRKIGKQSPKVKGAKK